MKPIEAVSQPRGFASGLLDFYTEVNDVLLAGFSARERTQLTGLLERVVANAEAALQEDR